MVDRKLPASVWHEKEFVNGRIENVLVIVLKTRGCSWARRSGCLMCGYLNETLEDVTQEEILEQLENGLKKHRGEEFVKIYTSGSFLDDAEIQPTTREKIIRRLAERCTHILFETRPEFVANAIPLKEYVPVLEVALGLETTDNLVLAKCVRKGTIVENYFEAMKILRREGIKIRTYLLLKPPFLTEKEAIRNTLVSIQAVAEHTDVISINPVNVQKGTFLEKMFLRGEYRPPWFWSLFEVIKKGKASVNKTLISYPSGGGSSRGIHNCKKCDEKAMALLSEYNLTQNPDILELECECKRTWEAQLELETVLRYSPYIAN